MFKNPGGATAPLLPTPISSVFLTGYHQQQPSESNNETVEDKAQ